MTEIEFMAQVDIMTEAVMDDLETDGLGKNRPTAWLNAELAQANQNCDPVMIAAIHQAMTN